MPNPLSLETLLVDIAHPTRKPASPRETPSSTASEYAGTQPATYPQAPATYPQDLDAPPPSRVDLRVMRVDAGNLPASGNNVLHEKNPDLAGLRVGSGMCAGETTTWAYLLTQLDALAARLVELQPPRLRIDLDARAVGYRSLEGLAPEGVTSLLREMLECLAQQYPHPSGTVQISALWPGVWPTPAHREVLDGWEVVTL